MYNKKTAQSIGIQLEALCQGQNAEIVDRAHKAASELVDALTVKSKVSGDDMKRLIQVLYAARAFDSGLRAFVDRYGIQMQPNTRHLKGYLVAMKNYEGDEFTPLNENVKKRIEDSIVYERNRIVHSAGRFPNHREMDTFMTNITDYMAHVLTLPNEEV